MNRTRRESIEEKYDWEMWLLEAGKIVAKPIQDKAIEKIVL